MNINLIMTMHGFQIQLLGLLNDIKKYLKFLIKKFEIVLEIVLEMVLKIVLEIELGHLAHYLI